jgi:hypothetical protein
LEDDGTAVVHRYVGADREVGPRHEFNPNHDERARFASANGVVFLGEARDPSSRPGLGSGQPGDIEMMGLILVLALSAPAMVQVDSMTVHRVCMRQAFDATDPTLDDPDRPVDLAEALNQYRIRLNTRLWRVHA